MKINNPYYTAVLFLCCALMLISCGDSKPVTFIENFPDVHHLKPEIVYFSDDSYLSRVYNLFVDNDYLIVYDEDNKSFFSIIDLKNHRIISKFGYKGQEPNEVLGMPQSIAVLKENHLCFFSPTQKSIFDVFYSDPEQPVVVKRESLEKKQPVLQLLPLAYGSSVGTGFIPTGRYLLVNSEGEESTFFDYPAFENADQFTNYQKAMAFQGQLQRRPDGRHFFFASDTSEWIEIIEITPDGELLKVYSFQGRMAVLKPEGDGVKSVSAIVKRESTCFFINAACTQNYIYLLYSGRVIGKSPYRAFRGSNVLVVDWAGNPVKRLNLNVDTNCIAVSGDDSTLYAVGELDDDTRIVKFNLQ